MRTLVAFLLLFIAFCDADVTVVCAGQNFDPQHVTISASETITWVGLSGHNVAQTDSAISTTWNTGLFPYSGPVDLVPEYSKQFTTVGTYYYICEAHVGSGMRGSITVNPAVSCYGKFPGDPTCCGGPGKGICASQDNCQCSQGYAGIECNSWNCSSVAQNDPSVCSARGTCTGADTCTCNNGFSGSNCENVNVSPNWTCHGINATLPNVCSSNGVCSSQDNCTCNSGYSGNKCEFPSCFGINSTNPNACNGNGQCTHVNTCVCSASWFGNQCGEFGCFGKQTTDPQVCNGKGVCSSWNNCTCANGFSGDQCQYPSCYGIQGNNPAVCSGHGQCSNVDQCTCDANWYGAQCSMTKCFGSFSNTTHGCSGNGNCTNYDVCSCDKTYGGPKCDIPSCFGILATNTSACSGGNNGSRCVGVNKCECGQFAAGEQCQFYLCKQGVGKGYLPSNDSKVCGGTFPASTIANAPHIPKGVCIGPDRCECKTYPIYLAGTTVRVGTITHPPPYCELSAGVGTRLSQVLMFFVYILYMIQ